MDRQTFTDKEVMELAESFTMLKVDCTAPDANVQALMNRFRVTGMPTLIFLSKAGEELEELREIGFIPPDEFVASMQLALETE